RRPPLPSSPTRRSSDLERITWADLPPLVPPGRTVQAALLLDPVATSLREHDRRLPASNVSTLQITSLQEPRDHFPGTLHAPPGLDRKSTRLNSSHVKIS